MRSLSGANHCSDSDTQRQLRGRAPRTTEHLRQVRRQALGAPRSMGKQVLPVPTHASHQSHRNTENKQAGAGRHSTEARQRSPPPPQAKTEGHPRAAAGEVAGTTSLSRGSRGGRNKALQDFKSKTKTAPMGLSNTQRVPRGRQRTALPFPRGAGGNSGKNTRARAGSLQTIVLVRPYQ